MAVKFTKDPDAVLDYTAKWEDWLAEGDKITAATSTISGSGLTAQSTSFTDETATVWLTGGTAPQTYTVTIHITTDDGREDDRSFLVVMKER